MQYSKYFSALMFIFLAGCAGTENATTEKPSVSVPAVRPSVSVPVKATPAPMPKEKAETPVAVPAETPQTPATVAEPKKTTPPPAAAPKTVETPSPDVPVVENTSKVVKFRCAYWRRPEKAPDLFVKTNGEYHRYQMFELSFPKIISLPVGEPLVFYVKTDDDFAPYFSLDPQGMNDCAAIIFPNFNPATPDGRDRVRLFDFSEKAAPLGSIVIYNWFEKGKRLECEFTFRTDGNDSTDRQIASLNYGEYCTTRPIDGMRKICGLKIFDGETKKEVRSTDMAIRNDSCTYIFLIPSADHAIDGAPDFRTFKRRD